MIAQVLDLFVPRERAEVCLSLFAGFWPRSARSDSVACIPNNLRTTGEEEGPAILSGALGPFTLTGLYA